MYRFCKKTLNEKMLGFYRFFLFGPKTSSRNYFKDLTYHFKPTYLKHSQQTEILVEVSMRTDSNKVDEL